MKELYLLLSVVILSAFSIISLLRESIERRKLQKIRLSIGCLLTFVSIILLIIFKGFSQPETIIYYVCPSLICVSGLLLLNSIFLTIKQKTINDIYASCVTEQYYFAYFNKKYKIRDISEAFADFFNVKKEEIYNVKDIF